MLDLERALLLAWGLFFLMFGFGIIHLFFKDLVWQIQDFSNRIRGIVNAERTPTWEKLTTITGLVGVAASFLSSGFTHSYKTLYERSA